MPPKRICTFILDEKKGEVCNREAEYEVGYGRAAFTTVYRCREHFLLLEVGQVRSFKTLRPPRPPLEGLPMPETEVE